MQILKAQDMGMCFGVRDALAKTQTISDPVQVTVFGQLVHNPLVSQRLAAGGFQMLDESQRGRLPDSTRVLVTAHGISEKTRAALLAAGKELIDTTCPLVKKAHAAAQRLRDQGCHVIVIGTPGHVEVNGIVEDLLSFAIVENPQAVQRYPFTKLGIVCQTTTPTAVAAAVRAKVAQLNPHAEIQFIDTVCQPTKDRQIALEELLGRVQAMVVVGGHHSNNTRRLVDRCRQRHVPAYHVQCAAELQPQWFKGVQTVGLTAGTSTLPETIDAVYQSLSTISSRPQTKSVPPRPARNWRKKINPRSQARYAATALEPPFRQTASRDSGGRTVPPSAVLAASSAREPKRGSDSLSARPPAGKKPTTLRPWNRNNVGHHDRKFWPDPKSMA